MSRPVDSLENRLRDHLASLGLVVGNRVPGERELAEALGVGRTALRPALDSLATTGVIERRAQSGTYLAAIPAPHVGDAHIALIAPFAGTGALGARETEPGWLHRVVNAFEKVAIAAGAQLRLIDQSPHAADPCSVKTLAKQALAEGANAVMLVHALGTRDVIRHALALIHDAGAHPVIVSARTYPGMASQVYFDSTWGAYRATRYLLDRGHRRIGFVGAPDGHEWVRDRCQGWRDALEAAEVDGEPWLYLPHDDAATERLAAPTDGAHALEAYLATPAAVRPTALLAANDVIALGLLTEAGRRGIAIPGNLSLIGFDNDPAALLAGLTTVERPTESLGEAAARTALERLAAGPEAAAITLRLRPVILERKTVGKAP